MFRLLLQRIGILMCVVLIPLPIAIVIGFQVERMAPRVWGQGASLLLSAYEYIPFVATDDPYFLWPLRIMIIVYVCLPYAILMHCAYSLLARRASMWSSVGHAH